jgi:hypothetical protein
MADQSTSQDPAPIGIDALGPDALTIKGMMLILLRADAIPGLTGNPDAPPKFRIEERANLPSAFTLHPVVINDVYVFYVRKGLFKPKNGVPMHKLQNRLQEVARMFIGAIRRALGIRRQRRHKKAVAVIEEQPATSTAAREELKVRQPYFAHV